jgi:Uma2 family endonuclease
METQVQLISYEESLLMPENKLEEILDGVSVIMPPPTTRHFLFVRKLSGELGRIFPSCDVCSQPYGLGIRRSPLRYRIPDISVFAPGVLAGATDAYIWTPPILVAECLSPSNRKGSVAQLIADYESIGVPELWYFYPEKRLFNRYLLEAGKLRLKGTREQGPISPANVEGEIELEDLWRAFHGGTGVPTAPK